MSELVEVFEDILAENIKEITGIYEAKIKELRAEIAAVKPAREPEDGAPGKSAYDISVEHGFKGTQAEWLASLKAEKPKDGEDGESASDEQVKAAVESYFKANPIPDPQEGAPGKSAYEVACEDGFKGTEAEWLKSLAGPAGRDGSDGKDGKSADEAIVRRAVESYVKENPPLPGEVGPEGKDGRDGRDGKDGKDGRDGIDGMHGKDALDIEILDGFDEEKNYKPGQMATKDGGLWRNTVGGWVCLIDGIKSFDVEMTDERNMVVRHEMASGKQVAKDFHVPAIIYREIWKDGTEYHAGDAVTHDGSVWIALKATKSRPGQFNKEWRLSVKKGRNGK